MERQDKTVEKRLKLQIYPFILRRMKRDVAKDLPDKVENVVKCKNPRCITTTEHYVPQIFRLVEKGESIYRCQYCDSLYKAGNITELMERNSNE